MRILAFGVSVTVLLGGHASVQAQTRSMDGATYIETSLRNRIEKEGGDASDLWRRPWRFVFLFNSSQAANKSAYTNSALSTVRTFLARRLQDGRAHKVWFYPYQLDLYTGNTQAVVDQPLTSQTAQLIERVFPRVPFAMRADGTTPYPPRGGHSNLSARQAASEIVGKSTTPTLLIQLTDVELSEAPGSVDDEAVRNESRPQGVDAAGLVAYDSVVGHLDTTMPGQRLYVLLYGPEKLASEPTGGPNLLPVVLYTIGGLTAVGLLVVLIRRFGNGAFGANTGWTILLPESASRTINKGESIVVVGPNAPGMTSNSIVLRQEGTPSGKLFELSWSPKGVVIKDHMWEVTCPTSDDPRLISTSARIVCKDKATGTGTRSIEVKITEAGN